ncbi:MAG TPA: SRPBCC family protein [Candidatus Acidoferrales bacterium]|jgi:hypothetical protein|nr:SRPBCC family protein [Candidatus Acidoferrales bacterium]
MAYVELSTQVSTTPNEIFVFFVPQRMPLWYGAEMSAHFEVQGGAPDFAVGQKVRITGKLQKFELTLTVVITAYEWDHHLEWQFQDSYGVRGMQRWDLVAEGSATNLIMSDDYTMPTTLAKIFDRFATKHAVEARNRSWLHRLKRLAERAER